MKDGNKESSKELLSTLRTVIALSLGLLIYASNRSFVPISGWVEEILYYAFFIFSVASIALAIYVCLVVISKLSSEVDDIIYQDDVHKTSLASLISFVSSCGLLVFIQNF